MELIMEQFPIVIQSLNVGFLQTLKLFFVTLLGALPLGLIIAFGSMSHFRPLKYITNIIVWVVRGTPLMIQMLIIYYFPGLVLNNVVWGGGESGWRLPLHLSLIMPVIFLLFTAVESRVYHRDRQRQDLYSE